MGDIAAMAAAAARKKRQGEHDNSNDCAVYVDEEGACSISGESKSFEYTDRAQEGVSIEGCDSMDSDMSYSASTQHKHSTLFTNRAAPRNPQETKQRSRTDELSITSSGSEEKPASLLIASSLESTSMNRNVTMTTTRMGKKRKNALHESTNLQSPKQRKSKRTKATSFTRSESSTTKTADSSKENVSSRSPSKKRKPVKVTRTAKAAKPSAKPTKINSAAKKVAKSKRTNKPNLEKNRLSQAVLDSRAGKAIVHWEQCFSDLQDFKKVHEHCLVPKMFEENQTLAYWVRRNRK